MTARSVVHLASEMTPLVKVGGLADVVGALAAEQSRRGHRVVVALPAYRTARLPEGWSREPLGSSEVPWGMGRELARFELACPRSGGPRVLLVDHGGERRFFDRPGVYDEPRTGEGYPDNAERFLFFARAAVEGLQRLGEPFDILHAHDQQAAWAPCFLRTHEAAKFRGTATVFTIHNLGYQGIYDPWVLGLAGFAREQFQPPSPFEFWGRVNYMKVGLGFADMLSTVSPRYAKEIQTSGEFGFGLEGVLRRRAKDLVGILNGIDVEEWNPANDRHLSAKYDLDHLEGKARCRETLMRVCSFPARPDRPIIGIVSRLVEQKGFDLIEQAELELLKLDARFVLLGSGQPRYQDLFTRLAREHPDRVYFRSGFDEPFAHLVEGGADLFLMPSRYEPCGLNQMYSMRYGTVPVVRETGGLADTVEEFELATRAGTGFLFQRYEPGEMLAAIRRALAIHRQPDRWAALQRNGMQKDFSWGRSADGYDRLYETALAKIATGVPTLETVRATI